MRGRNHTAAYPDPLPDNATTAVRAHVRGYLIVGARYDLQAFGYITEDGKEVSFGVDVGLPPSYLVPPAVEDYARKHRLYERCSAWIDVL